MPKIKRDYPVYIIAPFYIWNLKTRTDMCIAEIDTNIIKMINKRTKEEIKEYEDYI